MEPMDTSTDSYRWARSAVAALLLRLAQLIKRGVRL